MNGASFVMELMWCLMFRVIQVLAATTRPTRPTQPTIVTPRLPGSGYGSGA